MTNKNISALLPNPFTARSGIRDSRFFVGRKDELQSIINCMEGVQPTSVNIVGERRIGKTSLLYHLHQTWSERVREKDRFVVICLSMQDNRMRTKPDFFNTIAKELLKQSAVRNRYELADMLKHSLDQVKFDEAIKAFDEAGLLPVLCLDDFEMLFKHPEEFDNNFYEGLRHIMDQSRMMLVVTTPYPISYYKTKHRLTSTFFNNGRTEFLKGLKENEADDLLKLPCTTVKDASPVLNDREQKLAREWGNTHPFFLQMAACRLCEARLNGADENWARRHFNDDVKEYDKWGLKRSGLVLRSLYAILRFPLHIGSFAKKSGNTLGDIINWIIGFLLIIFLALAILKIIKADEIMTFIKEFID